MTDIEKAVRAAFLAGWHAGWGESGEGYNGEYCRAKAAEDNARAIDPPAFTGTAEEPSTCCSAAAPRCGCGS